MKFLIFSLLGASTLALPHQSYVVHERRGQAPSAWSKAPVDSNTIFPVRIGLTQQGLEKGHDLLMDVSSEHSPNYGKYYSQKEIVELFAPAKETVDRVTAWLARSGVDSTRISQSANKQWIQFDAPASEVEALLKTKYYMYRHEPSSVQNVACDEYHVPADVADHIDYITPGLRLLGPSMKHGSVNGHRRDLRLPMPQISQHATVSSAGSIADSCYKTVTPDCIKSFYGITNGTSSIKGNELGIFEFGDTYSNEDLDQFYSSYAPNIPQGTYPIIDSVDGAQAPTSQDNAGGESMLDFDVAYPIIYPQNTVLFQLAGDSGTEDAGLFNTFLDAIDGSYCSYSAYGETGDDPKYDPTYPGNGYNGKLQCGVYKPANVISISYGVQESDLPAYYSNRQCNEWMKLGLQGVTVLLASGDYGVGPQCLGDNGDIFSPDLTSSCPYMTAVGSTLYPPGAPLEPGHEVATQRFGSGGGFSNLHDTPSYQKDAVAAYFANHNPPYKSYSSSNNDSFGANGGIYNRNGRGYPDLAAVGDYIAEVVNGKEILNGGTSASCPIVAAMFNRINEERLAAGKSTIGFVNPVLYQHPEVFNDVVSGNNPGCYNLDTPSPGFDAVEGWDPVTGMGTPKYPEMLKLFFGL